MGAVIGVWFVTFFSFVNLFLWGDGGYIVHLLGVGVPAYSLVWFWVALIAIIYGANYSVNGHSAHSICHVIAGWWTANIAMTTVLNYINYRGIEESGGTIFGAPVLVLDFLAQGALDLFSVLLVLYLIKRGTLGASVWMLIFCGFMVANLFGHSTGAYNLMAGADIDTTAISYDSFMYLVFTLMLISQALGSTGDAWLRWSGANVDIYSDVRPYFRRVASRNLGVF